MRHRIFVGSSAEDIKIVRAVEKNFSHDPEIEVRSWTTLFSPGRTALDNLLRQTAENDIALFVFEPVDETTSRDATKRTPRDNVVFETGLFIGAHGQRRVFWVVPQGEPIHLPTDLAGIQPLTYKRPTSDWASALSVACDEVRQAIAEEDRIRADNHPALSFHAMGSVVKLVDRILRRAASEPIRTPAAIHVQENALTVERRKARPQIHIRFGGIEECATDARHAVVALPVNEYFDDCSINYEGSTVHAYAQKHFAGRVAAFNALIAEEVRARATRLVHRDTDSYADSLGVAECIYLSRPLDSPVDIILVSVATMRPGSGIHSEPHYLLAALHRINELMNEKHRSHLYVPLLGSGRGGLSPELSFLAMLLGSLELDCDDVTIVIFPRRKNQMSLHSVRRLVSLVTRATKFRGGR